MTVRRWLWWITAGVFAGVAVGVGAYAVRAFNLPLPDSPGPAADAVFGQPDFTTSICGSPAPDHMCWPAEVIFDDSGVMYVSVGYFDRVYVFTDLADTIADVVIGGETKAAPDPPASADRLNYPTGLAIWQGPDTTVLFVSDMNWFRVTAFLVRTPGGGFLSDTIADYVFGQPNFESATPNTGGRSANSINVPGGLDIYDPGGDTIALFLADRGNNRVLRYDLEKKKFGSPWTEMDTTADAVWGQANFTTGTAGISATKFNDPFDVEYFGGILYVVDHSNARVMLEMTGDTTFDRLYGQRNFTTVEAGYSDTLLVEPGTIAISPDGKTLAISDGVLDEEGRIVLHSSIDASDTRADDVIGDSDYVMDAFMGVTAKSLDLPDGLAFRTNDELWVCDGHNRVLRFDGISTVANDSLPVSHVITGDSRPLDVSNTAPATTTDSYVQIDLSGGETTSGALTSAATATGTGADYTITTNLLYPGDSLTIFIYTTETAPKVFVGFRTDTWTIPCAAFPAGIPCNDTGRRLVGATTVLLRFANSSGQLLGDSTHAFDVRDTFAYTLRYCLGETTTGWFHAVGFDTSAGSASFRHWYADTFGAPFQFDSSPTVTVTAQTGGGICVAVVGVTMSGVDPLGGQPSSTSAAAGDDGLCLFEAAGVPARWLAVLRAWRDRLLGGVVGRLLALLYYTLPSAIPSA